MKTLELLAPAKNKELGITAIKAGADAIYIGASNFGARKNASNSLEDIQQLVEYAHKFNVKVYVTINTILDDEEILEAQKLIFKLYKMKVDAIIVQDMGLLEFDLPDIALHSSTQSHNRDFQKVDFLEKVGFQRAILARELSLKEIKEIKNATNIELEAFVHGALCVSYSGQCYLSEAIGKRSANKGACAQPCRKKYTLVDKQENVLLKDKHLLSLKDLNLSDSIEDLIDAGVTSFKIEGRLKDENYIKNVVSFYRQKIDEIIEKNGYKRASSGVSSFDFMPDLNKTFNRDYSKYFLNGRQKGITSFATPKFKGEKVGKILEVKEKYFVTDTKLKLNNQDGLTYFENDELKGFYINKTENNKIFIHSTKGLKKGMVLFRNFDKKFNDTLSKSNITRKIRVDIKLKEEENNLVLSLKDEDGYSSKIEFKKDFELAQNEDKAFENYKKQLSKLGGTDFLMQNFEVDLNKIYFIPIKILNGLRRDIVEVHNKNRIENYKPLTFKKVKNDYPYYQKELGFEGNVYNKYAKAFYERHGTKIKEMAFETGLNPNGKKVMTTKHCLKFEAGLCGDKKDLFLIDDKNKKYELKFDCKRCVMEIYY